MKKTFIYFLISTLFILASVNSQAQIPVAKFTANDTVGCGFGIVRFTDQSTNNPTSWLWNFGDATANSTQQNPTHAYANPGVYSVSLTATNTSGNNTKTKSKLIVIYATPTANFSINATSGCTPFNAIYTNLSTVGSAPIVSTIWDFGDGSNSALNSPNHLYTTPGTFKVSLSVTDTNGCINKAIKTNFLTVNQTPTAAFTVTPTQSCAPPLAVNFTNTSIGAGLSYSWDFGDASTSAVAAPAHNYTNSGDFTIRLSVTAANGCIDSTKRVKFIQVGTYNSLFNATPKIGCTGTTFNFADSTKGATTWKWDFGDGITSIIKNPNHTYAIDGSYNITLITKNAINCIDTTTIINYITVTPKPIPNFTVDKQEDCNVPFAPIFTNTSTGAASSFWSFGDGGNSALTNPSHSYNILGNYAVKLVVTGANGCKDSITKANFILIHKPHATFTVDKNKGCAPVFVNFTNTSTDSIASVSYDFGDGSPVSTTKNSTHNYTTPGTYTVTYTLTDKYGCTDVNTVVKMIQVGTHTTPSFSALPLQGCRPLPVQFTDNSTGTPNSWKWVYEGGGSDTTQNPLHIYPDTGRFSVTLITGYNGCYDTVIQSKIIHVLPPRAIFSADVLTSCTSPILVTFTDASIGADSYAWDFGGGNTSAVQNPTFNFLTPGSFPVKLVVSNTITGCKDSLTVPISISNLIPSFTKSVPEICQFNSIHFTDNTVSAIPKKRWRWDFGDGTIIDSTINPINHSYNLGGKLAVKLVVTDQSGCSSIVTIDSVKIDSLPAPRFTADVTKGCAPLLVTFNSTIKSFGRGKPKAPITAWHWTFGDGATDNTANPTHNYVNPGSYTVTLRVTDSIGCDSTLTKINYIVPTHPQPKFTTTAFTCWSDSVHFINQTTGVGLHYTWNFGDGTPTSSVVNPYHHYNVLSDGIYTVSVTAVDTNGCDSTFSKTVNILRPVPLFSKTGDNTTCPPAFIDFVDASTGNVTSWDWNFGDASNTTGNTSNKQSPSHVYEAGKYSVTLIATDASGCKDTLKTPPNYISIDGPSGEYDFSPALGCAPLKVTFTAKNHSKTDSYTWIFGDGSSKTTTTDTVSYTYTSGNTFKPFLYLNNYTTTLGDTCSVPASPLIQNLVVYAGKTAFNTTTIPFSCTPVNFLFNDNSTAYQSIDSCKWFWGDGTSTALTYPTGVYPLSHMYSTNGQYNVKLKIFYQGCSDSLTKASFVDIFTPPALKFNMSDTASCPPLIVNLNIIDSTIVFPVNTWSWDFNDGSQTDANKNPTHIFNATGTYNIAVTVNFQNTCIHTYTQPSNLIVYPLPIANFAADTNNVYAGDVIAYTDLSTGVITNWNWTFGDQTSSTLKNPTHSYNYFEDYPVRLIVTTNHGCLDTITKTTSVIERLDIPNAFTPDGDGINDVFMKNVDLIILNRWGQQLYTGTNGWDGTSNGEQVLPGTYYFILTVNDIKGHPKKYYGSVTLLRK